MVRFKYDPKGNVVTLTTPAGQAHGMAYTPFDALACYTPPPVVGVDDVTTYVYNSDQQLWKVERGAVLTPVVTNAYQDGKLWTTTYNRGTGTVTNTREYDPTTGQLKTITTFDSTTGATNTLTYSYQGPLLTGETWTGQVQGGVSWTYDNDLRIQTENGLSYGYDDDGLLTSAGDETLTPDPTTGQLDSTSLGEVADSYTYYDDGTVHHYTATLNGAAIYDVDYTRDSLGRITVKKETEDGATHSTAYTYWPDGELWQVYKDKLNATGDGPPTDPSLIPDVTYTYDANGNRSSRTPADSSSSTAVVDAQDRLTGYGLYTYTYDDKGSLATKSDNSQPTLRSSIHRRSRRRFPADRW